MSVLRWVCVSSAAAIITASGTRRRAAVGVAPCDSQENRRLYRRATAERRDRIVDTEGGAGITVSVSPAAGR